MHLIHNLYLQGIKQTTAQEGWNSHDQQVLAMLLQGESLQAATGTAGGGVGGAAQDGAGAGTKEAGAGESVVLRCDCVGRRSLSGWCFVCIGPLSHV